MEMQQIDGKEIVVQSRWRSPVFWASFIAQILALIVFTGLDQSLGLDTGKIGDGVALILQILVTVGVLNNPSSKSTW